MKNYVFYCFPSGPAALSVHKDQLFTLLLTALRDDHIPLKLVAVRTVTLSVGLKNFLVEKEVPISVMYLYSKYVVCT